MRTSFALALMLLLTTAGTAWAQSAGRFIAVVGQVQVLGRDGAARTAVRDGELQQGESIVTGPNGLAQLRMRDGGAISVRPDTQLKLDAFKYTEGGGGDDSFLLSVLKGGLRTLTGLIARSKPDNFRISTPAVTIGVRGTDFEVVHVLQPTTPDVRPGTYNRVYDGITTVQNPGGLTLVSRDQTAFVPLTGNVRPVLVTPPVSLFGKPTPILEVDPRLRRPGTGPRTENKGAHKGALKAAIKGEMRGAIKGEIKGEALKAPALKFSPAYKFDPADKDRVVTPAPERAPLLLNPLDTPRTVSPTLTDPSRTVSPTLINPISPTPTTTLSPTSPTLTSPTTTTISPTLTAPTTTTISPTLTSPTTTTISPTLTSPTTTTISPILTAPTTTTISPTLTSPTTTTISPTLTAPTTTTISPTLTAPTTTTTSPTLTAPTTTTIIKR